MSQGLFSILRETIFARRAPLTAHDVKQLVIGLVAFAAAALFAFGLEGISARETVRPPAPRRVAAAAPNWATTVQQTQSGSHIIGNPDARRKLVEFVSYTCPHCAHFEEEGTRPLLVNFIADGSTSLEIRSFVRDPIDMAAATLVQCGTPAQFRLNHAAFLRSQQRWMALAQQVPPARAQRWQATDVTARLQAISEDLGFYAIMQTRGFTRAQTDRCLADTATRDQLVAMTDHASNALRIRGTPTFALNGAVLVATNDWQALEPQLRAR